MIIVKIMGGLGNQLFQYSTGRALSIMYNTELKVDLSFFKNPKYSIAYRLDKFNLPFTPADEFDFFHLKNKTIIPKLYRGLNRFGYKSSKYYNKTHIKENEVLALYKAQNKVENNYYIEGWLQSENYFKDYRTKIINDLNADHLLYNKNVIIQENIQNTNSVSVHIRRGDYITNGFFKTLTIDYYKNAISIIDANVQNPTFYFFSDDIAWVKKEFSNIPKSIFIDNNSIVESGYTTIGDIEDLMLMRKCKHHIIANSTFSWWGAWLNENPTKIVIAPLKWFNDNKTQKKIETNGFFPNTWLKI